MTKPDTLPFVPVVILGAGRSGTNALRDALTELEGFATWPCDEINPIWRHGNVDWPNDAIPPEKATRAAGYIRNAFWRIWRETDQQKFVVEKTCANTLRVPFVEAVLPEARYIHIVRDGADVVASAQKRWCGEMELAQLPYYWAKMRYAPFSDLPRYGLSFLRNRIAIACSDDKRMSTWGPRFDGMDELTRTEATIDAICAMQWVHCVEAAEKALKALPKEKVFLTRYEDFTTKPSDTLTQIMNFLETPYDSTAISNAVGKVSSRSVGKGRNGLIQDREELMKIMGPTLRRFGYEG